MKYTQMTDCSRWLFEGIPAFTDGEPDPLFADCGEGLTDGEGASFMHSFTRVNADSIRRYVRLLISEGFGLLFENTVGGDLFYQFRVPDGLFYISLMASSGAARFILDRCRQSDCASFGTDGGKAVREDTVLAQYSLHYGAMIRGTTCDCGMNYVYRLRDNSLIIIDGGEFEQATDAAVNDYMDFLRELTGTAEGEKLRIALWLCTHAHNDHCDFFSKLLRFHSGELITERAAFDFPSPDNVRHSPSVALVKQRLAKQCPGVLFCKLHAGCRFRIAEAEIEVLLSAEDTVGLRRDDPFPGTNDTSVIFTVTAGGVKTLFLADCGDRNGEALLSAYRDEDLRCDLLQAAHHGINEIFPVYERIDAKTVLLPQCRMNMDDRFSSVYRNLCARYGEENILFAAEKTDIFSCFDGQLLHTDRAHTGCAYDGSEW